MGTSHSNQSRAQRAPRQGAVSSKLRCICERVPLAMRFISSTARLTLLIGMSGYAFSQPASQPAYDLLLQGGHVIDPKNGISAVRDVAIKDGAIAAVAEHLDPAAALKVVNVAGLFVTPGLVDIHAHVYTGTGERGSYAGDLSLYPDGFTFRAGVTTVARSEEHTSELQSLRH